MLPLAKPRLIHFYVWWHNDKPVYVGQAADVEKRAKSHLRSHGSFGRFLRRHRTECCYEMLDTHVMDMPQGLKSVAVENCYISYYGTLWPGGFNRRLANHKGPLGCGQNHRGWRDVHRLRPEIAKEQGRMVGRMRAEWAKTHREEALAVSSRAGKASIAAGGGWKRAHELHPEMAVEVGRKGNREGKRLGGFNPKCRHVRWHVNRGVKNPNCKLCAESS